MPDKEIFHSNKLGLELLIFIKDRKELKNNVRHVTVQ